MPQISITVRSNAEVVRQGLENLSAAIPQVGRKRLRDAAEAVQTLMQVPAAPPGHPLNWDSDLQRRAYFATDGFGAGIPYVRTDNYIGSWNVVPAGDIGYRVESRSPYAMYVGGDARGMDQSNIHLDRWQNFRDAVDQVVDSLPTVVVAALKTLIARGPEGWTSLGESEVTGL